MKVDVWISIGVNIDVDDITDYTEIGDKCMPIVLEKIQMEGLYEHIEEVTPYDPDKID